MAGTYPDAPGPRVAYDRDGTILFNIDSTLNNIVQLANSVNISLNDESATGAYNPGASAYLLFMFPVLMDITHWAGWRGTSAGPVAAVCSTNTTNGVDGTWTSITIPTNSTTKGTLRTNIQAITANGVKAIRLQRTSPTAGDDAWYAYHFYGAPTATGDRLEFWHPTLDQPLRDTPAYFDFADIARDAVNIERDFRLKNISGTLSANTITVGCQALTDGSPTYVSQMEFRYDGGSYGATASLVSLAPGTISNIFTAKFDISATAALGVWTQRYYAQAASWS